MATKAPAKVQRARGRPVVIGPETPEIGDRIIDTITRRHQPDAAAAVAGINRDTLYAAVRHGRRVIDGRMPKGHRITAVDRYLADFSDRYARALAAAEVGTIDRIADAGLFPSVETKRTRKLIGTIDGPDGPEPVYAEEVTTTERPPDVSNLRWIAEKRWPDWAPRSRNEHSGPGGGPIPVELQVEGLMQKWAAARAEAAPAELEPGVIDVEPVEDK